MLKFKCTLLSLLALSCSVDSKSLPDCHPLFPECGDEDADGDGIVNRDDDFPADASCSVRDQNNCTGCGRGCDDDEWCSESYVCRAVEDEVCNGQDEDGDGHIDEAVTDAPLAQAEGVCGTARQQCVEGQYVNPDFSAIEIEGYMADNDPPCDGVDNDCDGRVDEGMADPEICDGIDNDCDGVMDEDIDSSLAPLSTLQAGVCEGSTKVCVMGAGYRDDYSAVDGFNEMERCDGADNDCDGRVDEDAGEPEVCDGADNDCDGSTDEGVLNACGQCGAAPDEVCDGADNDCDGAVDEDGGEPEVCDGADNDCDGAVDEDAGEPEVCDGDDNDCDGSTDEGVLNACGQCGAVPVEVCDGGDNDCDGSTDEELNAPLAENQIGVCEGVFQSCIEGDWVSDYSGLSEYEADIEQSLSDRLDNDCDGDVDEEPPPPCTPNCPDLDFVRIEGGRFIMGDQRSNPDPNETPLHNVNIAPFEMMRTEITVAQYRTCVNASACSTPSTGTSFTWSSNPSDLEDHPINGVSWHQFMEFAAWVGARLPTEAEWEYAARGEGQNLIYPWGDQTPTCEYAVIYSCENATWPVCSKPAGNTEQGLCDMSGNVWEWVQDEWHNNYDDAPTNGRGWCSGGCPINASDPRYNASNSADRVHRGGSWRMGTLALILGRLTDLRTAKRSFGGSTDRRYDEGARLARTVR